MNDNNSEKKPAILRFLNQTYLLTRKNDPRVRQKEKLLADWKRYWDKTYTFYHEVHKGKKRTIIFRFEDVKVSGKLQISAETNELDGDIKIKFNDGNEISLAKEKDKGVYHHMKEKDRLSFFNDLCDISNIEKIVNPLTTYPERFKICEKVTVEKKKKDDPKPPEPPNQAFLVEYYTDNKTLVCVKIFAENDETALKQTQIRYHPKKGPAKVTPWNFTKDEAGGEPKTFD